MNVTTLINNASSVAEAGTNVKEDAALLRRMLDMEQERASAMIDAMPAPIMAPSNLPAHLGRNIDTAA